MSLTGKTIVVTGASSGIGKAVALHLSEVGATCVLIGRNPERLAQVKAACGEKAIAIAADLNDFDGYDALVESIVNQAGPVYGLVHSAGIEQTLPMQLLKMQHLKDIFEVNVYSAVHLSSLLTKKKFREENQSIVIISSVMGVVGNKSLVSYSATKGAVIAMVRSMALELAAKGVRVNAVSPGHISDSEMAVIKEAKLSDEANQRIKDNHPLGLGKCEDVAFAVKFLLSEESKWITGQNLIVDGGYSIH